MIELLRLRSLGHVVRMGERDDPKWPGKLEQRVERPNGRSRQLGKKGYRRF